MVRLYCNSRVIETHRWKNKIKRRHSLASRPIKDKWGFQIEFIFLESEIKNRVRSFGDDI